MNIQGIAAETLEFILNVSESSYPYEFAGLLQARDGIISEVLILPGTESTDRSAVMKLFMMPNVKSAGSVHSHPSSNINPSKADLNMFARTGSHHIIVGYPYDENSWECYDSRGKIIELEVLDVELEDEELL
ncbi:Mov34/MPN/PAD-1 family protein [Methanosalsum natronophilum]|uniref:Metal-dependent protease of the PAD1/JAB1 superfamily n=1 Tax=Methanosalsum natronophilum TaxID=768733 RepID=A0A3R7WCW8_9EURY|nr:Mov34/MPN/PAD-1 family protein [Methanosalsum natronophilum]MCS3924286.1 proteasome lid subunit RPN8/RPN11 [Methanosalsum natronophilum]RQD82389.1 MAG: metal-dependent protease of the PAD1/JAB1 superfamily [Methanosalsum natronophilum]